LIHNIPKPKKKIGIDKQPVITDNVTHPSQFDVDLAGDEDSTLWVYKSNLQSEEITQSLGADILQKLIRAVSGKK